MSVESIKAALKGYAKDLRINIGNVLTEENSPGLSEKQIFGCALSAALAAGHPFVSKQLLSAAKESLSGEDVSGIKAAVSLMGMNNVYYRAMHLAEDKDLSQRPPRLRMIMMQSHGIPQKDFELYSLAVSAISGCGMCLKSHTVQLKREGISLEGVHSALRIAAVVQGVCQSLKLESLTKAGEEQPSAN